MREIHFAKFRKLLSIRTFISLALICVVTFLFFLVIVESRNQFSLVDVVTPQIPAEILTAMETQIPGETKSIGEWEFKWFDYYDFESGEKIKVKLNGLTTGHYHNLSGKSTAYDSDLGDYKIKTIGSDLSLTTPDAGYLVTFSEYVSSQLFDTPVDIQLGINNDLLVEKWTESTEPRIKENFFINWNSVYKLSEFGKDELAQNYLSLWKNSADVSEEQIDQFIDLLNNSSRNRNLSPMTQLDLPIKDADYANFLAQSAIISTGHMDTHNLYFTFSGNKIKQEIIDPSGYFLPNISPYIVTNPISEYYLQDPAFIYQYLQILEQYRKDIYEKEKLSNLIDSLSCNDRSLFKLLEKQLKEVSNTEYPIRDINGYCASNSRMSSFENLRNTYIKNQLSSASLRISKIEDQNKSILFWIPTMVPVQINKITCNNRNCSDSWELKNPPWWSKDNDGIIGEVFSSQIVRKYTPEVDTLLTKTKTVVEPEPYFYELEYTGDGSISQMSIEFNVENAITHEKIYSVTDEMPQLVVSEVNPNRGAIHSIQIEVRNTGSESYHFTNSNLDWVLKAQSHQCINGDISSVGDNQFEYSMDCSGIDESLWPYPLNYEVSLYYKGAMIRRSLGQVYQDIEIKNEGKDLSPISINQYQVSEQTFKDYIDRKLNSKISEDERTALSIIIEKTSKIFIINGNCDYSVSDDLILSNSILVFEEGSKIIVYPYKRFEVGTIISLGEEDNPVIFNAIADDLPWGGIIVKNGFYLDKTEISNTDNEADGLINVKDSRFAIATNSSFRANRSNIEINNSIFRFSQLSFSGGKSGIKGSNSMGDIKNIQCVNKMQYCVNLYDSKATISDITMNNILVWGFKITGAAANVSIKNVVANDVSALIYLRYLPSVTYDFSTFALTDIGTLLIDMDHLNYYDEKSAFSGDDFMAKYQKFLFRSDRSTNEFMFYKNAPVINRDIIVPEGVTLIVQEGSDIKIDKGNSIVVVGDLLVNGTQRNPVTFSGNGDGWGSLLIWKGNAKIRWATFKDGNGDYLFGFEYSGMVTADKGSDVTLSNVEIEGSEGDDGFNCKYSLCTIEDSSFTRNSMDGIDFDFALEGSRIENNEFVENGNDAIDLSASKVLIKNNNVSKSGDKCVSIGESSYALLVNNVFSGCLKGIEVKDASVAYLTENSFENNELDLSGYIKKQRFGIGGKITYFGLEDNFLSLSQELDDYSTCINVDGGRNEAINYSGIADE